ncbi:hypothetical protein [Deefgea piscis]|uniref:hypothetical protein n=1 Tax=Deefgea piscis TaxID=2739061 RepID=UPI001C805510|nr:hypothetical protein [Deefgea piscis]QZA80689.1 hypothetical protein K4H25_14485 [Deefgea piscis]
MARVWTDEQRQRQRELIQRTQPWRKSTGPVTAAGKAVSSQNATVHGFCSNRVRVRLRDTMRVMKQVKREIKLYGLEF